MKGAVRFKFGTDIAFLCKDYKTTPIYIPPPGSRGLISKLWDPL